jgi:hypothetical protein
MTTTPTRLAGAAALALAAATPALAQFDYDEAVSGDLSNDIANPTNLGPTGLGVNSASFSIVDSALPGGDFDVFTFQIQDGQELAEIILADYIGLDGLSFIAFQDEATFPVNPNTGDPFAFAGGALFGTDAQGIGNDILADLLIPTAGGSGFVGPVGPGDYTFFVQQTGTLTEVQLDFVVIPAPASAGLLLVAGLAARRRR